MDSYSMDLRQRVVAACDARDGTSEEIAARFSVSVRQIGGLLRRRLETGSIASKPAAAGGPPPSTRPPRPDSARPSARTTTPRSRSSTRPPASHAASRHSTGQCAAWASLERKVAAGGREDHPGLKEQRAAWRREFAAVDPSRLVFVDESGASTAMDRRYGRAASGKRVDGPVPHGHWMVMMPTAAVRLGGVPQPACLAFDGATDSAAFETYVERCLAPALRPGDIVIMDNLACHKTAEAARLIAAAGAEVRFLPPYSPDLNPIEKDQADSTSSDNWCEATGAGYDLRRRVARTCRVVPASTDPVARRDPMPASRRIAPPAPDDHALAADAHPRRLGAAPGRPPATAPRTARATPDKAPGGQAWRGGRS